MTTFCFHVQQYLQSGWLLENLPNHLYIYLSALEAIKGPKLPFPEMGFHSLDLQHQWPYYPNLYCLRLNKCLSSMSFSSSFDSQLSILTLFNLIHMVQVKRCPKKRWHVWWCIMCWLPLNTPWKSIVSWGLQKKVWDKE